jgi:hypothetical protein
MAIERETRQDDGSMGGLFVRTARGSGEDCLMKICDDVPEIVGMIADLKQFVKANDKDILNSLDGIFSERLAHFFSNLSNAVTSHILSESILKNFRNLVDKDLNDPNLKQARIEINWLFGVVIRDDAEWITRRIYDAGDLIDSCVTFGIRHPKIMQFAKENWGNNDRVTFFDGSLESPEIIEKRDNEFKKWMEGQGISTDTAVWAWAMEAIETAKSALDEVEYHFNLCDIVEWNCSNIDEIERWDSHHGPAIFLAKCKFGDYFSAGKNYKKSVFERVWISPAGTLIGPLWEYLYFACELQTDNAVTFRDLGIIGEGLHVAVEAARQNAIPENIEPELRNDFERTQERLFEAGKAVMRLRMRLELAKTVQQGRKSEFVREKAGASGGKASKSNRKARVADLLSGLERIIAASPREAKYGAKAVADELVEELAEANPKLWSEGKGQIDQYLGELRRGDAGPDLKARYLALFHPKPPKRLGR